MEEKIPHKISRTILYLKEINVKIHIKLIDNNYNFQNVFNFGDKTYMKLEPMVYLTLELTRGEEGFIPNRSLWITQANINSLINSMKKVLKNIYKEKIFALRGNEIIIYEELAKKFSEKIILPNTDQAVMIKPSVVYDENEVSYEGVTLYINKLENVVNLSIEEFESLVYTLNQIDLFQYSQLILNYVAIRYPNGISNGQKPNIPKRKTTINWEDNTNNEVTSNFRKISDDNSIFKGLNSDEI